MIDILIQVIATIGGIALLTEWRYRTLHGCIKRVEERLDTHLDR